MSHDLTYSRLTLRYTCRPDSDDHLLCDDVGMTTTSLPKDVWDSLCKDARNDFGEEQTILRAVSIRATRQSWTYADEVPGTDAEPWGGNGNGKPPSRLRSLLCYANLDTSIASGSDIISIPSYYTGTYPHIFGESTSTVSISVVSPPELTHVFLSALSHEAYELAQRDPNKVETWFCETKTRGAKFIIRQGETYTFEDNRPLNGFTDSEKGNLHTSSGSRYAVLMTEPVLQGLAVLGFTVFVISPGSASSPKTQNNHIIIESNPDSDTGSLFEDELSIDESFLARSTSTPLLSSFQQSGATTKPITQKSFQLSPLIQQSQEKEADLDDLHVRTQDLAKIGAFSGDWVVVNASDADGGSKTVRLACVLSTDGRFAKYSVSSQALASPILIHNLRLPTPLTQVYIAPTPFASCLPPIPTAATITLARIASPITNDKRMQDAIVRGLRLHFANRRVLVKRDDLIGVPVVLSRSEETEDDEDIANGNAGQDGKENGQEDGLASSSAAATRAVVFFKVTHLEHSVIDTITSTSDANEDTAFDAYVAATMGELGCYIDSTVTKMVQAGVEHSLIPARVQSYYGISTGVPSPPSRSASTAITPFEKLYEIVSTCLLPSAADYALHISVLLKGVRGIGKRTVVQWVAEQLGVHVFEINSYDVVGESPVKTEGTLRARFDQAAACSPCIFLLSHIEALARKSQELESGREPPILPAIHECLEEIRRAWHDTGYPIILVATTSDVEHLPIGILGCFKHEIAFEAPNEQERLTILRNLLESTDEGSQTLPIAPDVTLTGIATQTAALVANDLVDLVSRTKMAAMGRALKAVPAKSTSESNTVQAADIMAAGVQLTSADFEVALGDARATYSESIGAPKIPNVSWDDVGGLGSVKRDILDTIQLPLEHPELFADGMKKRSGILLYGPPGTGKTLLAKAVATSCSLNFFSVKGPELLNMYIGESEANVRRVFQRARDAKPCVIFFDELDSVAPKRGNHGDSGGVMDRIVSQLLAELDGMADGGSGADVFVIGATNRPDLLDSALLRPGRFDRMLYLGVSDTHEAQFKIIQALTRKFRLDPALDLHNVADKCPFNYTGADFYALCSDAMLKAMSRKAEEIEATIATLNSQPPPHTHPHPITPQYYLAEMASDAETDVLVSQEDFDGALRELVPSVSASEMEHYALVQQKFAKDTINSATATPSPAEDRKGKGKAREVD
ncbi:peroxisomal assembly protein [Tulasnella sp. JGI-2019a]|nr:peroxisomal assembly protein [Tulasnella sp. JGI-2019a]